MHNSELTFLQSLTEAELCELVIAPLLTRMGYRNVRYTHGPMEFGKDVVFSQQDPLARVRHYAAVVKRGPLSGSASNANSIRTVLNQIQQGLDTPFFDTHDGKDITIDCVYLIVAHPISQQAVASCRGLLSQQTHRLAIIDGPALLDLIHQYHPDVAWSLPKGLPTIVANPKVSPQISKKAFVLTPFGGHFDSYYAAIYKPGLEAAGYLVQRGDDISTPQPIIKDIQESIVQADVILCEMSGRSPNVFYELGLAHAVGKPVILLSDNLADVPFDLRHIRVISYDCKVPDWAPRVRDAIRSAALSINPSEIWPPPLRKV